MRTVRLLMVGGFLGAGKTTLLWEAALRLTDRGMRVGLITNDQAPDLVDTGILVGRGLDVREVAGSCFCCNFDGLIGAAETLRNDIGADVLIAEPVGSCTDLSATIIQPLKDNFRQEFVLSPLSVLVDPVRLGNFLLGRSRMHRSAAYILEKQLEEADLIVLNKIDLLPRDALDKLHSFVSERFPGMPVAGISALNGTGVDDWLDDMLASDTAGGHVVEVDYDIYAEGEAVLGWVNADVRLSPANCCADWRGFASDLLGGIQQQCCRRGAEIGHVKLLLTTGDGELTGSFTQLHEAVSLRGDVDCPRADARLILNARVEMPADDLRQLVLAQLAHAARSKISYEVADLQCLTPGRPQPTHRYDAVVD